VNNINLTNCVFSGVKGKNYFKNIGKVTLTNVLINGVGVSKE